MTLLLGQQKHAAHAGKAESFVAMVECNSLQVTLLSADHISNPPRVNGQRRSVAKKKWIFKSIRLSEDTFRFPHVLEHLERK